jgi:hypothetical protein
MANTEGRRAAASARASHRRCIALDPIAPE